MNPTQQPSLLRPRWRKVFSDLWEDKTRTALVVASIAAGVFAIGMIITAYAILSRDINRNYAAVNPPNIVISTDPFNIDLLRAISRMPGVSQAEGRFIVDIRAQERCKLARSGARGHSGVRGLHQPPHADRGRFNTGSE